MNLFILSLFSPLVFIFDLNVQSKTYPLALIHGFGDNCNSDLIKYFEESLNVYVKCIPSGEMWETITLSMEEQSIRACNYLNSDQNFFGDFNLITISQGGLIARYIIEKCDLKGTVRKVVAIGGPMMGTAKVPKCLNGVLCFILRSFANYLAYKYQSTGPFGYYKPLSHLNEFNVENSFLADLNNEKIYNKTYKDNIEKL